MCRIYDWMSDEEILLGLIKAKEDILLKYIPKPYHKSIKKFLFGRQYPIKIIDGKCEDGIYYTDFIEWIHENGIYNQIKRELRLKKLLDD